MQPFVTLERGFRGEVFPAEFACYTSSAMSIAQAISDLKADPESFLRASPLKIFGGGKTSFDGPVNFKMEVNPEGGYKAIYVAQDTAPLGADQLQAWYIPMQQLQGFTVNWRPKPEDTPLRLLLTSQITGCLFGIGSSAQGTCVAQIQADKKSHMDKTGPNCREARQQDLWTSAATAGALVYGGMTYSIDTELLHRHGTTPSTRNTWRSWASGGSSPNAMTA